MYYINNSEHIKGKLTQYYLNKLCVLKMSVYVCMGVLIDSVKLYYTHVGKQTVCNGTCTVNELHTCIKLQASHIWWKQSECDYFIALYYFFAC